MYVCVCVCAPTRVSQCVTRVHIRTSRRNTLQVFSGPTLAAGLELKFLVCINVLYVLVPVLVHVLLDGSGHDSAEIDGTVERHATSAPSKQPVPAPRHSTTKPSTKPEFHLELGDASRTHKTIEPTQEAQSPSKSKIPVKVDPRSPKLTDDFEVIARSTTEFVPQALTRTVKYITREYTDGELTKETVAKNIKSDDETAMSRTEMAPSMEPIRQTTITTSDPSVDPEKLQELLKAGGVVETVRTVTLTSEDASQPMTREAVVERINQVTGTLSSEIFDFGDKFPDSSVTTVTTDRPDDVVQTITRVQRVTMEMPETERTRRVVKTMISSDGGDYDDAEFALKSLQERLTKSEIGETASWLAGEQWETGTQYSQDTSPGSGNGGGGDGGGGVDLFAGSNNKNGGSSRHDVHSDTDSDGSPQPRRRSPSKRRTLGSSSGSDVALHEGAELSPLEDDQGTALSQLSF